MLLTLAVALTLAKAPATAALVKEKGGMFIKAGKKQGVKVGDEVAVLSGDKDVGAATVMEVLPAKSRVSLDEEATKHPEAKKVRLGGAKAAAAPAAAPAEPAAQKGLKGRATIFGFGPAKQIALYNQGDEKWTNCELRLPTNKRYKLAELRNDDQERIFLHMFKQDGIELDRELETMTVSCDQGTTKFDFESP